MHLRIRLVLLVGLLFCAGCSKEKSTADLIADLDSSRERDRIVAVRLLPQRKEDAAQIVPALIGALKDKESDIRWSAAIGLGYFGEQARAAILALQIAENDRDARVREAAAIALARVAPDRFSPPSPLRAPVRK
jgi:HEAT repeat protein